MNPVLVTLIVIMLLAAGMIAASTTGFFTTSVPAQGSDADSDDESPFRISIRTDEGDSASVAPPAGKDGPGDGQEALDEDMQKEENATGAETGSPPGTGGSAGGFSGGGSSGGGSSGGGDAPACSPSTCSSLGYECGTWEDGCGGALECGTCSSGYVCTAGSCVAVMSADVYLDPEDANVSVNEEFTAEVRIDSEAEVFAAEATIRFDTGLLEAVQVDEGSFLSSFQDPLIEIDNGTITYANVRLNDDGSQSGKSGSGVLVSVTFRGLEPGTAPIDLGADLVNLEVKGIMAEVTDGEVTVNG